jgi:ribonuclease HI
MTDPSLYDWLTANLTLYVHGDLRKRIPLPGVYAIYVPFTGQVYFGQTKHLFRGRLKHMRALKRGVAENKGLQRAFKAGKRTFDFYYINLPDHIAKEVVQDYIGLHHGQPYLLNQIEPTRSHKVHYTAPTDRLKSPSPIGLVPTEQKGIEVMSITTEAAGASKGLGVVAAPAPKAVKAAPVDDAPLGLVYYTDGGCRPNPGPGGWGLHGYLYRAAKPKKGSGNPDHILTAAAYVLKTDFAKQQGVEWSLDDFNDYLKNPMGKKKHLEITPVQYIDGFGSFHAPVTNNIAELVAATEAMIHASAFDVRIVQVHLDSQYVCKGLAEYVPTWIRNNWIKTTGEVVKNAEYWKKLVSARDILTNRGVEVRFDWIRAHNDHLGNETADQAATIGVFTSQKHLYGKSWAYSPEAPAAATHAEITMSDADGYWKYDAEKHPFIAMPRMYFNTCTDYLCPGEYYLSNGKEEEHPGKRVADGAYAVIKLKTPDPILEMIRNHQSKLAENVMALASARLDFIYRPDEHKKLSLHGPLVMVQDNPKRLDTFDLHSLDKDKQKEPITREHQPAHLAMRAVESVEMLLKRFNQYLEKDPEIVVTDLTDILYEKSQKVVKKETVDICTLNPKYNVGFAALPVDANYKTDEGIGQASVTLTLGIDLLDRNALKRLESSHPKVSLISWLEAPGIFRYATVIEAGDDIGIWAGVYSNVRIVIPGK